MPRLFIKNEKTLILIDLTGANGGKYPLEPGEHEILEIPDPLISDEEGKRKFWVLATKSSVGMSIAMWKKHGIYPYEK